MSQCYKCHRELPGAQVECEPECQPQLRPILTDEEILEHVRDHERNYVEIDWEKVRTLEDLKQVIQTLTFVTSVRRGSEEYHELRKFLKEKNPHD